MINDSKHLYWIYYKLLILLRAVCIGSQFKIPIFWNREYYYLHFTAEEIVAQRGTETYPELHWNLNRKIFWKLIHCY